MKIVKEHINEKFTADSDPIDDLGIGMKNQIENFIINNVRGGIKFISDEKNRKMYYLYVCIYWDKYDFVKFLLEDNAIPTKAEFMCAFGKGHYDIYRLLQKYDKKHQDPHLL